LSIEESRNKILAIRRAKEREEEERQAREFDAAWETHNQDFLSLNGKAVHKEPTDHSVQGKVLQAARSLRQPFSLTELVLAAWKLSPKMFGLPGSEANYPSDRRVYVSLCGKKGLVACGWIRKLPKNMMEAIRQ
jgi:hypothetical protein